MYNKPRSGSFRRQTKKWFVTFCNITEPCCWPSRMVVVCLLFDRDCLYRQVYGVICLAVPVGNILGRSCVSTGSLHLSNAFNKLATTCPTLYIFHFQSNTSPWTSALFFIVLFLSSSSRNWGEKKKKKRMSLCDGCQGKRATDLVSI